MDRQYFKLIEAAHEIAILANSFAMNANHRPDVEAQSDAWLKLLIHDVSIARESMKKAVYRQMHDDPTERDL